MASIFDLLGMGAQAGATPPIYNPNQNQSEVIPETIDTTPIVSDPAPEHKGLFGVKGTLRDLLGMAGDFRANMEGRPGRYEQLRKQEQIGDAMRGFNEDPMTAIRRVFKADGKLGNEMLESYREQETKRLLAEEKRREQGRQIIQGMLGTIKDDRTYAKMAPLLRQSAQRYGVPAEEIDPYLGDKYDPDLIAAYRYGGFPVDRQIAAEETRRYHDLQDENADQRTGIQASRAAAQNAQGARRTSAYERNVANQIERRNNPVARPSSKTSTPRPKGSGPAVGTKKGGYTFMGGNPADPKSWKKD
jgi:hypothetical protein